MSISKVCNFWCTPSEVLQGTFPDLCLWELACSLSLWNSLVWFPRFSAKSKHLVFFSGQDFALTIPQFRLSLHSSYHNSGWVRPRKSESLSQICPNLGLEHWNSTLLASILTSSKDLKWIQAPHIFIQGFLSRKNCYNLLVRLQISSLSPSSGPYLSSGNHFPRLFQKIIKGFDCKVMTKLWGPLSGTALVGLTGKYKHRALPSLQQSSFGGSDRQA